MPEFKQLQGVPVVTNASDLLLQNHTLLGHKVPSAGCMVPITSTVIAEIHFYIVINNFIPKSFQPSGSLWNLNITKIETELEVNFTTSNLGLEYLILLYEHQKYEVLLEKNHGSNANFLLNRNKLKA